MKEIDESALFVRAHTALLMRATIWRKYTETSSSPDERSTRTHTYYDWDFWDGCVPVNMDELPESIRPLWEGKVAEARRALDSAETQADAQQALEAKLEAISFPETDGLRSCEVYAFSANVLDFKAKRAEARNPDTNRVLVPAEMAIDSEEFSVWLNAAASAFYRAICARIDEKEPAGGWVKVDGF